MILGNRIKKLRKELDLTQQELGKRIGIKPNSISLIESGNRNASEQVILSICREFNVSESWLRTGEGEMFSKRSESDELAAAVERLITGESAEFKRRLINALSTLKDEHWLLLEEKLKEIVGIREAPSLDIEAEVSAYRTELEAQQESQEVASGESTASVGSSGSGRRMA